MSTTTKKVAATKKPVKKVVAKKVATKAVSKVKKVTAKKGPAVKSLVYADDVHSFWVIDGQILNSLMALHNALSAMSKDTFDHHVAKGKHDFAEWVSAVLDDQACATDLKKAKTANSAKIAVAKHLKSYSL